MRLDRPDLACDHHPDVTRLSTALAAVSILVACRADADSLPPVQPPACPAEGRARLLLDDPATLLPCALSDQYVDLAWGAHAATATGAHAAAAASWAKAAKAAPTELKPVLGLARADALAAAGQTSEARGALPAITEPRWLAADTAARGARWALEAGDTSGAATLAAQAMELGHDDRAALVAIRFQAALARELKAEAGKWLRTLTIEHPHAPEAEQARQAAQGKLAETAFVLTAGDYERRWRTWRLNGSASAVARECKSLEGSLTGPRADPARYECGESLSTLRDAQAEALLRQGARSPSVRGKALLAIARVRGRANAPAPVEEICSELRKPNAGTARQRAECDYLAAFLHLELDREKGRAALEKVTRDHPKQGRAADARWLLALDSLRHEPKAAFARFDALVKSAGDAEAAAQALYWRGRVRHADEPEKAKADWRAAIARDPFGYYALLSASRLGEKPAKGACGGKHAIASDTPEASRLAAQLLETGFRKYAAHELAARVNKRSDEALQWSGFLAAAGQYRLLLDVGLARARSVSFPITTQARAALEASYPLAFPQAIAALPSDLDPCFVLSLMRRESRYDPDAVSAAQAHGLLQLLPSTAKQAAAELGLPAPRPAELFEPALNVRLAGQYVQRLNARFGHPLLAAAAYNAGPSAVAKWVKASEGVEIDEWVERIPYRETRHYVKAVAGAWNAYGLIWAGARPALPLVTVGHDAGGVDY